MYLLDGKLLKFEELPEGACVPLTEEFLRRWACSGADTAIYCPYVPLQISKIFDEGSGEGKQAMETD